MDTQISYTIFHIKFLENPSPSKSIYYIFFSLIFKDWVKYKVLLMGMKIWFGSLRKNILKVASPTPI